MTGTQVLLDGRYRPLRVLGRGGMGTVWLARDERLARDVALKRLDGRSLGDEAFAERFRREARAAGRLSHPHVVKVYDQGEDGDGVPYIAMEHVAGPSLAQLLEQGPLASARAVELVAEVLD